MAPSCFQKAIKIVATRSRRRPAGRPHLVYHAESDSTKSTSGGIFMQILSSVIAREEARSALSLMTFLWRATKDQITCGVIISSIRIDEHFRTDATANGKGVHFYESRDPSLFPILILNGEEKMPRLSNSPLCHLLLLCSWISIHDGYSVQHLF